MSIHVIEPVVRCIWMHMGFLILNVQNKNLHKFEVRNLYTAHLAKRKVLKKTMSQTKAYLGPGKRF